MSLAGVIAVLAAVASACAVLVIVIAPWRRVRQDGPLPPDTQTRLLLGEDPAAVAADEDATSAEPPRSPTPIAPERPEVS